MATSKTLENCCFQLESNKVTSRKQACDELTELFRQKSVIELITESDVDWWNKLLSSIQQCLSKDHDKRLDETRKRGSVLNTAPPSADLFATFLRVAVKESASSLNYHELLNFLTIWLDDESKKHFHYTFLRVISHCFLSNTQVRSILKSSDWESLYFLLKSLCGKNVSDTEQIKCLALVIKWGPLYKFPVSLFRDEFHFVVKLCKIVGATSPKPQQEALLELVFDFCKHAAKDNRMACCKLGEDIFKSLYELYHRNSNEDKLKSTLVEFFLLQVKLHHPKGVRREHKAAYAVNWESWHQCLQIMYQILTNEVDKNLELTARNQSFFVQKNGQELYDTFVELFVEVARQLFYEAVCEEERPRKRPRVEFTVDNLIENVRMTKSWTWLNLTYSVIETYPDMITSENHKTFVTVLLQLQVDCKNPRLLHHIYKALLVLIKIGDGDIWGTVADCVLRSIAQNDEQIQKLLQQLILRKYLTSHETLFQYFRVGALNVTEHNLKTLRVAFETFTYLQYDGGVKREVIKWVLSNNTLYSHSYVAELLVCLILKQWPNDFGFDFETQVKKPFRDIEDVYMITSLETLLGSVDKPKGGDTATSFYADQNLLDYLSDLLTKLTNNLEVQKQISELLNVTVLVFNIVSYLLKFGFVSVDCNLCAYFDLCARSLFTNLSVKVERNDEKCIENVTKVIQVLNVLFSTKTSDVMAKKLRQIVPESLVKALFEDLTIEFEDVAHEDFKKRVVETLVSYSVLPDCNDLSLNQQRALEVLLETDYEYSSDSDYELIVTLLHSFKMCKSETITENNLFSIFNIFQKVCEVRYHCYLSAVTILELFYEVYPFAASSSDICKSQFVQILYPFYCKKLDYGPSVSVNLLRCMSLIFELEPSCAHSKWNNDEIVLKIPEFLSSEYQEVRFAAVSALASFYRISSNTRLLDQYHRQEMIFAKIAETSLAVFQIEGDVRNERIIDETVTRTSSILHTFASIMTSSYLWVEEALFTLLRIVCDKKLDLSQVVTVLEMVAQSLGYPSHLKLLEKYLVGLVNRWKSCSFASFPLQIFSCDSKVAFFVKYWKLLAHIFVEGDKNSMNQVATIFGTSLQKLIEDACPKLLSYSMGQEISDLAAIAHNKIYRLLADTLGKDKLCQIFKSNVEEVILCVTEFVSDETSFKRSFGQNIIFPKACEIRITVDEFHDCLQFIERTLYNESVVLYLMRNNPEKIHFILLQLNLRVSTSLALEEKLRYFHLYSIFSELCVDAVTSEPSLQTYLIRDLTHSLLHRIKSHRKDPQLSEVSCKFFKTLLKKMLPGLCGVLARFFLVIISRLKNVALEECAISDLCIDMLQFLIVDHQTYFRSEIEKLDSIPQNPKFDKIFTVHYAIKYNERKVTLDDEIKQFLESFEDCEHSLVHLRTLLAEKKDELKSMCLELRQTRGFARDCETSSLHKLICRLVTLGKNVRSEAVRCLGEIGPSDLNTMILQPENAIPDKQWTPWELVLGHAVSLLSKYLIDPDVQVIRAASLALFQILATKEGRKVAESETDFGFGAIDCSYLTPFCAIRVRKTFGIGINTDVFMSAIQDDNLWIPQSTCHKTWVTRLVSTLLETFKEGDFFATFIEVCKVKVEFCEQILPPLINTLLSMNTQALTKLISAQIAKFFNAHWNITVNKQKIVSIATEKASVQSMLNVVHFVRLQQSVRNKEIKNLNFDYLKVAKAAHFCTAHFTALLYAELWCQERIDESGKDYALSTCSYTKLDLIYEKVDELTGNALQNILREAYKAVGEVDALLGCGTSHLLDPTTRVEHYKELGRWDQVSHRYDLEASVGRNSQRHLVESLKNANLYQLSLFCSEEPDYESLWRLGRWDYAKTDLTRSYDKCKFYAFKALSDNDEFSFVKSVDEGRACVVGEFETNMESIKNFYKTLGKLQSLKELEDFERSLKDEKVAELLVKWRVQDEIISNDYQFMEPIHAQRIVLLTELLKKRGPHEANFKDAIMETIIDYARCARIEGNSRVASRTLENLLHLQTSNDIAAKIQLEEAQLCWSIQDVITAKRILKQLYTNENVSPRLHATALKMTGQWMVESSSENRQTIIDNYFKKSIDILKKEAQKAKEDEKSVLDTFNQLAKFADREYQEVMTHIKSDIFQKKKQNVVKAMQAISAINIDKATKDLKKAVVIKKKLSTIDQAEISNMETDKNNLLHLALRYYLLNLIGSDDHNMAIFRLFSLLLENRDNEVVKPILVTHLLKIPTYKFINILPQIIPHITSSSDLFGQTVNDVIEQCAKDHPYHTLPLILALALSNKDRDYAAESKAVANDARKQSAESILKKLKKEQNLRGLIDKMEFLSDAVIELAYKKTKGDEDQKFKVPRECKIRKIQNYDDVLLPTYTLPVNKSCNYERIIGIKSFSDVYQNVGGINAPKRITCTGTDGVTRSQLIKGQDDLRQDAVMQQVFTIMNSLLGVNKQTKNLLIRTYKIVPLSMRSGILEWVENTMPIGVYLTGENGDGGAHVKFRPMDENPMKCRSDFKKFSEDKVKIFNKICGRIQPVFHKFFETNFPQPTVWYEKRRAYTHSVATSSMCGYILGIGDRHVNNILIDKSTAEVVHIDFGIAFEQGRVLPTPETVPFRLTRDIVDGMGVSGIEGVFRRSCEKTVEVLRLHYQTIITILEVLLYDPLYDWTVSTAEANKRQKVEQDDSDLNVSLGGGSDESPSKDVNVTAERALLRLRAKLQGTESGKATNVEHQVGTLIQQAVDPSNLSRLFCGWQPYL